jgi:hypothetical protein
VTGNGTNSNINADDNNATVAAIQLNVAMLRLSERKQPAIGSLLTKMRLLTVGVVLL